MSENQPGYSTTEEQQSFNELPQEKQDEIVEASHAEADFVLEQLAPDLAPLTDQLIPLDAQISIAHAVGATEMIHMLEEKNARIKEEIREKTDLAFEELPKKFQEKVEKLIDAVGKVVSRYPGSPEDAIKDGTVENIVVGEFSQEELRYLAIRLESEVIDASGSYSDKSLFFGEDGRRLMVPLKIGDKLPNESQPSEGYWDWAVVNLEHQDGEDRYSQIAPEFIQIIALPGAAGIGKRKNIQFLPGEERAARKQL